MRTMTDVQIAIGFIKNWRRTNHDRVVLDPNANPPTDIRTTTDKVHEYVGSDMSKHEFSHLHRGVHAWAWGVYRLLMEKMKDGWSVGQGLDYCRDMRKKLPEMLTVYDFAHQCEPGVKGFGYLHNSAPQVAKEAQVLTEFLVGSGHAIGEAVHWLSAIEKAHDHKFPVEFWTTKDQYNQLNQIENSAASKALVETRNLLKKMRSGEIEGDIHTVRLVTEATTSGKVFYFANHSGGTEPGAAANYVSAEGDYSDIKTTTPVEEEVKTLRKENKGQADAIVTLEETNKRLKTENKALRAEIDALKHAAYPGVFTSAKMDGESRRRPDPELVAEIKRRSEDGTDAHKIRLQDVLAAFGVAHEITLDSGVGHSSGVSIPMSYSKAVGYRDRFKNDFWRDIVKEYERLGLVEEEEGPEQLL